MKDGLDVITVRVTHEGAEVSLVVLRPEPRRVELHGAEGQRCLVEGPHLVSLPAWKAMWVSRLGPSAAPLPIQNAGKSRP